VVMSVSHKLQDKTRQFGVVPFYPGWHYPASRSRINPLQPACPLPLHCPRLATEITRMRSIDSGTRQARVSDPLMPSFTFSLLVGVLVIEIESH